MPNIFNVVVDTDDLAVIGPPDAIEISVDIGDTGPRGSKIWVGAGDPNVYDFGGSDIKIDDYYINVAVSSQYGWLYLYTASPTGNIWEQALRLQPSVYFKNYVATFTAGSATITIPLTDIAAEGIITDPSRYIANITPIYSDPVALSVNSTSVSGSNLILVVEAVKSVALTWSDLAETVTLGVMVAVV